MYKGFWGCWTHLQSWNYNWRSQLLRKIALLQHIAAFCGKVDCIEEFDKNLVYFICFLQLTAIKIFCRRMINNFSEGISTLLHCDTDLDLVMQWYCLLSYHFFSFFWFLLCHNIIKIPNFFLLGPNTTASNMLFYFCAINLQS